MNEVLCELVQHIFDIFESECSSKTNMNENVIK